MTAGTTAVLVAVCLLLSAYFSGTETGLISVSRVRLRRLAAGGERRVAAVLRQLDRLEEAVLTLLICNNLVNVLASALVTMAFVARYGERGEAIAVAATAAATVVFSEIVPKVMFREYPERLTMAAVPILRVFHLLVAPARWLLQHYAGLLRRILGADRSAGQAIDRTGLVALLVSEGAPATQDRRFRQALERFLRLSGETVSNLMRPRGKIVSLPAGVALGDALALAARSGYSRLPVEGDNPGRLVGYLLVRDLLFLAEEPGADLAAPIGPHLIRTILEVDGNLSPYELFEELHHQQHQLALVVDRSGRVLGLLTLEDLIEKVTGSIADEFDPQERDAEVTS